MKDDIENSNEQKLENDTETRELFNTLCEELEGVIPEDIFTKIKEIKPVEAAIMLLWQYGGCIRLNNPEVDLKCEYEFPEEVKELNDAVESYSFAIAETPFIALAQAAAAEQDFNEEIIMSRDLKGYVPLVIEKDGKVQHVCLVNYEDHTLERTMNLGLRLDIDMTGNPQEQETAMAEGMRGLEQYLDELKKSMENPPKLFEDPDEERAVDTWAKKHSYTIQRVFRASMDRYF
ncbi:hypothetical protein [Anaerotardibacter muris]|uniref:hypothetical protein n=1 Tax=Anaerotardibacter muris TaxID=2941505 RepID=UPI00203E2064|nr:hypothetical protein [Anaerotardibacter muris]